MTETAAGVWRFAERYGLLEAGDTVVAGVSGGADSVCLLLVLLEITERVPLQLSAVHVHHGIRKRADEEEAFVRELCKRLSVPCRVFHEDVPGYAKEMGLSEEEAGRELRYRDFETALREADTGRQQTGTGRQQTEPGQQQTEPGRQQTEPGRQQTEPGRQQAGPSAAGKIAVAHHADDCAETLLFHLFRGTGLTGMGGIRPRRGNVVRPLLELSRTRIEEYLKEQGQPWCTDESNESDSYTRNKIRHHILPYAEKEICHGAGAHLAKEAALLAQAADYMNRRTEEALSRCLVQAADYMNRRTEEALSRCLVQAADYRNRRTEEALSRCLEPEADDRNRRTLKVCAGPGIRLSAEAFRREEELLQSLMLRECIRQLGRAKDMTAGNVETLARLFQADCRSGRRVSVSGIRAVREFGTVYLTPEFPARKAACPKAEESLPCAARRPAEGLPGTESLPAEESLACALSKEAGSFRLAGLGEAVWRVFEASAESDFLEKIPRNRYTKWFDYDKIIQSARFRTRRQGDYLTIDGHLHRKKLQDYMIEEKIPVTERDAVLLLADGAHIMWVPGHRISTAYKVTSETKRILEVYVRGGT